MTTRLLTDALVISARWTDELNVNVLVEGQMRDAGLLDAHLTVDVVALGKASRIMASGAREILGRRTRRQFLVVADDDGEISGPGAGVMVGDHPVPSARSLAAGRGLVAFLDESSADVTLFLISGGASSVCAWPAGALGVVELGEIWRAALAAGVDITTLNQLRAATSRIAGGAILRHVRTPRSLSLIMVDNVVSGPQWVASALTYEYRPSLADVSRLVRSIGQSGTNLEAAIVSAFEDRRSVWAEPMTTAHQNRTVAEPVMMLELARREASRLGYRVVDMGSAVSGDVGDVVRQWGDVIAAASAPVDRCCVLGAGEVTVKVRGGGVGGRCQEFAWRMAAVLSERTSDGVFVARSSDGQDFVPGVAGAWVDRSTTSRALEQGIDVEHLLATNDVFHGLEALDQLIAGRPTGWNLCDLYVATF